MPAPPLTYRPEIDGLRAIAVLVVVAFHAKVPGFSGGFVGVDVFFVISGYLIARIVRADLDAGRFSFASFYRRRAQRILPALALVLLACLVLSFVLIDPNETRTVGLSVAASATFLANLYFATIPDGYFAAPVDDLPLVHLWSLAVEGQFYFLFPVVLVLARRRALWAIGLLACVSLGISELLAAHDVARAYFGLGSRAWELLAGALLACWREPSAPARWHPAAALLGLIAILWASASYGAQTRFPGIHALPVVVGTAMIVRYARENAAARLLAWRPLVAVGLISYSLYLWHQPMLAFARSIALRPLALGESAALVSLSFLLAYLSWRFVEVPCRSRTAFRTPAAVLAGLGLFASTFVGGAALWASGGAPQRFGPRHHELVAMGQEGARSFASCALTRIDVERGKAPCVAGSAGPLRTALIGDSHALAIGPAVGRALPAERVLLLTPVGCPPVTDPAALPASKAHCIPFMRREIARVANAPGIDTVILGARWSYNLSLTFPPGSAERSNETPRTPEQMRITAAAYSRTAKQLLDAGKRVILVYPIPEPGRDVPLLIARAEWLGRPLRSLSRRAVDARDQAANRALDAIGRHPRLIRLYPVNGLCDTASCRLARNGAPLYFDDDHLTAAGADMALPDLQAQLRR